MKTKLIALGSILTVAVLLILGAALPAPIQRNQFSTNVQGQPVIGTWIYSNAAGPTTGTNFFICSEQGINGYGLIGQTWGLVDPMIVTTGDVFQWANSQGVLRTNGSAVIRGIQNYGFRVNTSVLVPSTGTTNQIDPSIANSYRWTNMTTNVTIQLTNLVADSELDFYFTGGTNTGPNYTVFFTVPNPAGVLIHWGGNSPTNGPTSFTVTNNQRMAAFVRTWLETTTTNLEAYWQVLPK